MVVGCQRSGTMIASKILAEYFEADWLDEFDVLPTVRGAWRLQKLFDNGITNLVVQCPVALKDWERFYSYVPNIKFVFIHRNKEDILNSMRRIEWLKDDHPDDWEEFMSNQVDEMRDRWEDLKERVPQEFWRELQYEDFKEHPLFIPKEERTNFTVKQWERNKPCQNLKWTTDHGCTKKNLITRQEEDTVMFINPI